MNSQCPRCFSSMFLRIGDRCKFCIDAEVSHHGLGRLVNVHVRHPGQEEKPTVVVKEDTSSWVNATFGG